MSVAAVVPVRSMSYYVIIRGPAGVGKTTIGRSLASRINASVTHFDKVMEEMGMDYVEGEKWIPLQRFLKADEALLPKLADELDGGRNVVLDGNFYHREQIEDLTGKLDFPHAVFTLKADLDECLKRDRARNNALGERGIEDVFGLVGAFDYGNVIQTKGKTADEVVEEIMATLNSIFG